MNRLKELRQEKKLSQKEIALELQVPPRTYQRWENGESQIKPDKAQALADYFNVSVGYLLGFEQQLINDNEFLRDENTRLNRELSTLSYAVAKSNLLDKLIEEGCILQSTLDKCIAKLDEIDRRELERG